MATERRNEDPPNRWFPRRPEKRGEAVRGPEGQSPASPPPPPPSLTPRFSRELSSFGGAEAHGSGGRAEEG